VEQVEPEVPKLEPGQTSPSQLEDLRRHIEDVQSRIAARGRGPLSAAAKKDLDDATNFAEQSMQALAAGDFPRSSTLFHKALLLVEAVEQQR
jgi:hypothetical protein